MEADINEMKEELDAPAIIDASLEERPVAILPTSSSLLCTVNNCKNKKPFSTKGTLTKHLENVHNEIPKHKCKYCDNVYTKRESW